LTHSSSGDSTITRESINFIFGNLEEILLMNEQLLSLLKFAWEKWPQEQLFGSAFVKVVSSLKKFYVEVEMKIGSVDE
jgi:hypothetical protein